MLSNRLRELSLMEAIPTRRPHLPQQPEQIERLRTHLRRMAKEARTNEGCAEIWRLATQTYGESELQDLKDVHWKALTVLDKLHRRDRRVREKGIAEYAREASKEAAGLLHHLTKPRAVRCQRDSAQGEATNPRDAAELAANGWARMWRVHVEELQTADRPQTVRTRLFCLSSQLTDHLVSMRWLARSRPRRALVSMRFIPQCRQGKQLYTDLLNDVERTLTWPAQIQTLIYFLVPKTPTGERPIGLMPSIVRVWERSTNPFWING